jgi:hypothetical protein
MIIIWISELSVIFLLFWFILPSPHTRSAERSTKAHAITQCQSRAWTQSNLVLRWRSAIAIPSRSLATGSKNSHWPHFRQQKCQGWSGHHTAFGCIWSSSSDGKTTSDLVRCRRHCERSTPIWYASADLTMGFRDLSLSLFWEFGKSLTVSKL